MALEPEGPDAVDVSVGLAIRARRKALGVTQNTLAEAIGVSFQQIQKYERAANRVSASMLVRIAKTLECGAGDLLPEAGHPPAPQIDAAVKLLAAQGGAELVAAFLKLSPATRQAIVTFARSLARQQAA